MWKLWNYTQAATLKYEISTTWEMKSSTTTSKDFQIVNGTGTDHKV